MRKITVVIIALCLSSIQISCSDSNDNYSQSGPCSAFTYSSDAPKDLNGPDEEGSVSFAQECEYLYIGGIGLSPDTFIYKINLSTNEIIYKSVPQQAFRMILVGNYLWTAGPTDGVGKCYLQKIDKNSLTRVWEDHSTFDDVRSLAFDGKYIWAADRRPSNKLHRIDPDTNTITSYSGIVLNGARHMVFDGTYLWITCNESHAIVRINPKDLTFITIDGLTQIWAICFDGSNIIAASKQGNIYKIIPGTAEIIQNSTIPGCNWLCHADFDGRYIWVTDNDKTEIKVVDPFNLTLVTTKTTFTMPHMSHYDGKYQWVLHEKDIRLLKLTP